MKILTHSGIFHADEICAIAWIKWVLMDSSITVLRSRNQDEILAADIVVDVGGILDPENKRFDHHQCDVGFYSNKYNVQLSSFGLVLKYLKDTRDTTFNDYIYQKLGQYVDMQDNGQHLNAFTYSDFCSTYNTDNIYDKEQDVAFDVIVSHTLGLINRFWISFKKEKRAINDVLDAVAKASNYIIEFNKFIPSWIQIMDKNNLLDNHYRIIWPDGDNWKIRACPSKADDNNSIKPLQVPDIIKSDKNFIFVHKTGFIAGTKSKKLAIKLAQNS